MALSRLQRQAIIEALINEIGKSSYNTGFTVENFAKSYKLSRQSVYRYLKTLEEESIIKKQKDGRDNRYYLVDKIFKFMFSLSELSEDTVWNKSIKPLLQEMPEIVLKICNYAFCEILNNAIDHSEGKSVTIFVYINAFRVSIRIKDDGIGVFTKIAAAMDFSEKRFSILELAKGKFTTDPESHTGEGIFFSSKATDVFCIFSDDLLFISNNHSDNQREQIQDYYEPVLSESGTTVIMEVFRNHNIPLSEIFDRYTQEPDQYGFTKTVVPVKLLEHGDPNPTFVSRSAAKRLLARFDRFERIELDFTDIDEIGQGFADEVFRVFQNQHPNSVIIAINHNQLIEKMIRRVKASK